MINIFKIIFISNFKFLQLNIVPSLYANIKSTETQIIPKICHFFVQKKNIIEHKLKVLKNIKNSF